MQKCATLANLIKSRKMLHNDYSLVHIGSDTAESELPKVPQT